MNESIIVMNLDSCFRTNPAEQLLQGAHSQCNAAGGRRVVRADQMQEYCAAPARDAGPGIVVDFDDAVVEMVLAPKPVTGFIGGAPERPVVAPVRGIFTPGSCPIDAADRQ